MGTDLDKFKRHCNMGVDVELENAKGEKDTFKLKPLNPKQFATFSYLADKHNKEGLSMEDTNQMLSLFTDVIKNSYPDLDDDIADNFALFNLADFMLVMDKLAPKVDKRKADQINKIKQMQEAGKKQDAGKPEQQGNSANTE